MTGKIGDIKAKCPSCGKTTFKAAAGNKPKADDRLTCAGCGRVFRYRDLAAQIGDEATKRAAKILGDMVKGLNRRK